MRSNDKLANCAEALTKGLPATLKHTSPAEAAQHMLINGHANELVYDALTREERRANGIFFSDAKWARALVEKIDLRKWKRFLDPSCGTGDLLIEICKQLPLKSSRSETVLAWSRMLGAIERNEHFLKIAWARIQALAMQRHGEPIDESGFIPMPGGFLAANALKVPLDIKEGDCVVMNPPFQRVPTHPKSEIGRGLRSAAAVHIERVLSFAPNNVAFAAILPEVLRSGTLYHSFREMLDRRLAVSQFSCEGNFGGDADIDVAILHGVTCKKIVDDVASQSSATGNGNGRKAPSCVGDLFSVQVGPVVPHRAPRAGQRYSYLTARNCPAWGTVNVSTETDRFKAKVMSGPFVVVRRTSSPADTKRARATLVKGKGPWLVDNHLLVLTPKSRSVGDCAKLLVSLQDNRTDDWLNRQIRCRHLTVSSILNLPIWLD
jgi:hypothetical protein